jgi:hypothetical protein
MVLTYDWDVLFFQLRWILCFPLHALSFCFQVVMKTPRFITSNDPIKTSLHCVKNQMKCEADVSGHMSRFETPFLQQFFSFPNIPLQYVTLFPYSYSILLLLLSYLPFNLSVPRFILCAYLYLSFAFIAVHFLDHLAHLLTLPWTACAIQKHSISS